MHKNLFPVLFLLFLSACSSASYQGISGSDQGKKVTIKSRIDGTDYDDTFNKNSNKDEKKVVKTNSKNNNNEKSTSTNKGDTSKTTTIIKKPVVVKDSNNTISSKLDSTKSSDSKKNISTSSGAITISNKNNNKVVSSKLDSTKSLDSKKSISTSSGAITVSNKNNPLEKNTSKTATITPTDTSDKVIFKNPDINDTKNFLFPIKNPSILKAYKEGSYSGIDFKVPKSSNVYAVAPGMVIFSGEKPSLGKSIFIYHSNGYVSIYTGLEEVRLKKGDYVNNTDSIIAQASDDFGFEFRKRTNDGTIPLDPNKFLKKR